MIFEGKELPDFYKGYSTRELLDLWEKIAEGRAEEDADREMIIVMDDLIRRYRLSVEAQAGWEMHEQAMHNISKRDEKGKA